MSKLSPTDAGGNAPPMTRAGTGYASTWKIWLPVLAFFVFIDVTFNAYFWQIPKLSKANADYGYQFVIDALPLWQEAPHAGNRVLAFGSSIALSFDPRQVQSLLEAAQPQESFDVHRLLLPGAHPSDYVLYFSERSMPRTPDVVVILVNLVDFLYPNSERDVNPTVRFILSPWKLLAERRERMSITSQLDAALSGVSRLYRYRKLIRSSLHDHVQAGLRWARQPRSRTPYGVDADGYTRQSFGLPLRAGSPTTLKYFIDPEWIRQRGLVKLEFSAAGQVLATRVEREPGWKTIRVDGVPASTTLLEGRIDSLWTPRGAESTGDPRLRGVLLADPPKVAQASVAVPFRYRLWQHGEVDDFLRMGGETGDEFAAIWQSTLDSDTRFGQRFRRYRDAKLGLSAQPFKAGGEYQAVRQLVELFRDRGAQVIVINSPESRWILQGYRDTPYYRGYLDFFRALAATSPQVRFYDWSDSLAAEDFNDWHHPSYIGSIKLGLRYADVVARVLSAGGRERSH